jgi:hypothetical protein
MGYAIVVTLISILVGTIPIGYDAWPNIIGILIGTGLIAAFVYFGCAPVLSPTGRYDPMTELFLMIRGDDDLMKLKEDTAKAFIGELAPAKDVEGDVEGKLLDNSSDGHDAAKEEVPPIMDMAKVEHEA